jgi:hypothetical protein
MTGRELMKNLLQTNLDAEVVVLSNLDSERNRIVSVTQTYDTKTVHIQTMQLKTKKSRGLR